MIAIMKIEFFFRSYSETTIVMIIRENFFYVIVILKTLLIYLAWSVYKLLEADFN